MDYIHQVHSLSKRKRRHTNLHKVKSGSEIFNDPLQDDFLFPVLPDKSINVPAESSCRKIQAESPAPEETAEFPDIEAILERHSPSDSYIKESGKKRDRSFTGTTTPSSKATLIEPQPVSKTPKKANAMSLQEMTYEILQRLTFIRHDNCVYYYNHKCYQIIEDWVALLELVCSEVSEDAFNSFTLSKFGHLFTYLKTRPRFIPVDYKKRLQRSAYYISLKNGVIDLKSMKLLPHSPKYLIFYSLDANWIPHPTTRYFQQFLQNVSGGDSQISLRIMESLGYMLSPLNCGKCFFVMGNAQNSGKSTLGKFLQEVLGQKLVSTKSVEQLSERFSLGDVPGKLLNLSMDLPKEKLNANTVSIVKQITGGDTITVEKKYDKQREVAHCNMRFLFASNHPVTISPNDEDDAFWDRMIVIPFLYSIDRASADNDFLEKLLDEKDDIISSCIIALGNVINNNYIFSPCEAADQLKRNWRYRVYDDTKSIPLFVDHCLDITENPEDKLYLKELYDQYADFCDNYNLPIAKYNSFSKWLVSNIDKCGKKRIHKTGQNPRYGITGLKLKEHPDNI